MARIHTSGALFGANAQVPCWFYYHSLISSTTGASCYKFCQHLLVLVSDSDLQVVKENSEQPKIQLGL